MTTKQRVRAVLDRLPEDCSLDDVLYHLYVLAADLEAMHRKGLGQGRAIAVHSRLQQQEEATAARTR